MGLHKALSCFINSLEIKLLLISINFTLQTSHSCPKKGTFLCFPGGVFSWVGVIEWPPPLSLASTAFSSVSISKISSDSQVFRRWAISEDIARRRGWPNEKPVEMSILKKNWSVFCNTPFLPYRIHMVQFTLYIWHNLPCIMYIYIYNYIFAWYDYTFTIRNQPAAVLGGVEMESWS